MLPQEALIEHVRQVCIGDVVVEAVLMYGSFAQGMADEHSDIEFWIFFDHSSLPVDPVSWCTRIGLSSHAVVNEFGAVVVFFRGLVRGEFHLAATDDIESVRRWPARGAPVEDMVIVDAGGRLRAALESVPHSPHTPTTGPEVERLCGQFANWLVLACHVNARGETLRALDALSHAQRLLLHLARMVEHTTEPWLTPSRKAERGLSTTAIEQIRATYKQPAHIDAALTNTWVAGRAWWSVLADYWGFSTPRKLWEELDVAVHGGDSPRSDI